MMGSEDIRDLLLEWARWRYVDSGNNIGFPSRSAFAREMPPNPGEWGARTPLIDNEMAGRVDRAVGILKIVCKQTKGDARWDVLTDKYLLGRSDSRIARAMRMDRRSVLMIRQNAENYISGIIDYELWNR